MGPSGLAASPVKGPRSPFGYPANRVAMGMQRSATFLHLSYKSPSIIMKTIFASLLVLSLLAPAFTIAQSDDDQKPYQTKTFSGANALRARTSGER